MHFQLTPVTRILAIAMDNVRDMRFCQQTSQLFVTALWDGLELSVTMVGTIHCCTLYFVHLNLIHACVL